MSLLFFIASAFPAFAINFGMGNVPSRYLALGILPGFKTLAKIDLVFLALVAIHVFYIVAVIPVRPFHLLDASYLLGYVYVFVGLQIVRKNLVGFRRFVFLFWLANILYATYQNIVLACGLDQKYALFHQNVHHVDYVIPVVELMPVLFRVTGLFIESAPFVLYLMFTHLAFTAMGFSRTIKRVNILFILLAGAKVGYLFVLLLMLNAIISKIRINILIPLLSGIVIAVAITPVILDLLIEYRIFGSIYARLVPLFNLLTLFSDSPFRMLFGYGFVSSTELMSGEFEGAQRGIDFFSTYIVANGIIGSALLLAPLYFWFKPHLSHLSLREKNMLVIVITLALLSMGSLLNFQYAYLLFIVAGVSRMRRSERGLVAVKSKLAGI